MNKITKLAIAGATSAIMLSSFAGVAFASGSGGSQATACGATHGAFADVNGNFGFLGEDGGTPGYHDGAVGQEQPATGYNNSHVDCNPQD
jgi:hypothetical protein